MKKLSSLILLSIIAFACDAQIVKSLTARDYIRSRGPVYIDAASLYINRNGDTLKQWVTNDTAYIECATCAYLNIFPTNTNLTATDDTQIPYDSAGTLKGSNKFRRDYTTDNFIVKGSTYFQDTSSNGIAEFNMLSGKPYVALCDNDENWNGTNFKMIDAIEHTSIYTDSLSVYIPKTAESYFRINTYEQRVRFGDFEHHYNGNYIDHSNFTGTTVNGSFTISDIYDTPGVSFFSYGSGDVTIGYTPHESTWRYAQREFYTNVDSFKITYLAGAGGVVHATSTGKLVISTVTNAELAGSIAYSKLSLSSSIVNGDIVSLAWSKITSTPTSLSGYGISATSANVASAVTDETGTGSLVFSSSPTFVTPRIGTPDVGVLTNCTGLPISTGVSGLGSGVASALQTSSSANWASAFTDETGTGNIVYSASPTFTGTPTLPTGTIATTQTPGNNTTAIGTTQYVVAALPKPSYTINQASGTITAAVTAGTFILTQAGGAVRANSTAAAQGISSFYLDDAYFPTMNGISPKVRVLATIYTNNVAPTGNFTFGLYPVTVTSGAGAGLCNQTLGTVIASSNDVTFTTPAANGTSSAIGAGFTFPADGTYAIGLVTTATIATSAFVTMNVYVQVYYP